MPTRRTRTRSAGHRGGIAALAAGLAVIGLSVGLMLARVGATTTTKPTGPPAPEAPSAFLAQLGAALRQGDVDVLLSRLDPAVIQRFGVNACRAHLSQLRDPTASFSVLSTGTPGVYVFATGSQRTEVPDTVPVSVRFTERGVTRTETVHLARLASGRLAWFTDCR